MELSKKTTILFPPDLHEDLLRLARAKGCSLGALIRDAVRKQYGLASREDRLKAVADLAELALPVRDVDEMIAQSTPRLELPE